jgi:PAS domain S-box-containing protein
MIMDRHEKPDRRLNENLKELTCLNTIATIVERPRITLEEILQEIIETLPLAWQYPEVTGVYLIIDGKEFKTSNYRETEWQQSADITVNSIQAGKLVVGYLEEKPDGDEGPFLRAERLLIDVVAERMGRIIERMRITADLLSSEARYRRLFETAQEAILILDGDTGKIIDANPFIKDLLGYSMEELLGKSMWEIETLIDTLASKLSYKQLHDSGYVRYENLPLVAKDGRQIAVEVVANAYVVDHQKVIKCNVRDITDRKRSEETLLAEQENLRNSMHNSPLGIQILDGKGKLVYINNTMLGMWGYETNEQLRSVPIKQAFTPTSASLIREMFREHKSGVVPLPHELTMIRRDGHLREVRVHCKEAIWNGEMSLQMLYEDITERKQAEQALRESERRLREAQSTGRIGDWEYDFVTKKIIWSDEMFELYERDKALGPPIVEEDAAYYSLQEIVRFNELNQQAINTGQSVQYDMKVRLPNGKAMFFNNTFRAIKDPDGKMVKFIGTVQDITERKQVEQNIANQFATIKSIIDSNNAPIFSVDRNYCYTSFNNVHAEIMKSIYNKEIEIGKSLLDYMTVAVDRIIAKVNIDHALNGIQLTEESYSGEESLSRRYFEVSHNPIKGQSGEVIGVSVFARDITDHKRSEDSRQKTEKLESLGTLAGGIAHDFNNILTGILGNIQLTEGYLKQNRTNKALEMLVEAEKASLRARDLTHQLLTFSRGGIPVKKVMQIDTLIRESATFALRGSRVKPEFAIADNLWAVEADEGQINQVINNLIINANQAMPNGGIINIRASNIVNNEQRLLAMPDGDYIEISIRDYGIGIPEGNKARMFEPYFTTKGKGSGLGLATSYSIIKNHGGTITFESKLGVGTTFHMYLPATKEALKKKEEKVDEQRIIPMSHDRILVMDDEEGIRKLLSNMLKDAGYEVELTQNGIEAIQKYTEAKKSGQPFDVVILDLTVPGGMGGKDVIVKLLEIDPEVKAIVSSGYADDPIMAEYKKYGFRGVVTKPYNLKLMRETISSILVNK